MKYFLALLSSIVIVVAVYLAGVQLDWYGNLESAGTSVDDVYPKELVEKKAKTQEDYPKK